MSCALGGAAYLPGQAKKHNFLTNVVSKLYYSFCYLIPFGPVDTVNRADEEFDLKVQSHAFFSFTISMHLVSIFM